MASGGGFNPKAYLAEGMDGGPAFDPKAYIAQGDHGMKEADVSGAGQAALEHFGNAASMGYLPQLQAMAGKLMPNPNAEVDAKLAAQGFKVQQPQESYVDARDANIKRLAQQSAEHPYASGAGTVAGILGGGALTSAALPLAPAASLGARVAQGAKVGAAMGAAANPGDTEGEIDPLQLDKRAKNAAVGAALGGALPVAVEGVKAGAGKTADYLRTKAAEKAYRALGRQAPEAMLKATRSGENVVTGRELLDNNAIPVLGTPKRIASRVDALKDKAWASVDELLNKGGDNALIDGSELGVKLLDSPEVALLRKTPGAEGTVKAVEQAAETLANNGKMTVQEAQAVKKSIDKLINYNKAIPDMTGAQQARAMSRTALRDEMDSAVTSMGADKGALKGAFKKYGRLEGASEVLDKEIARDQNNRMISLTDTIMAASGPTAAAKVALGAANKFGRTFGNSIQARGYDAISKGMPSVAKAAQAVGSNAVGATRVAQSVASPQDNREAAQTVDDATLGIFKNDPSLIDSIGDPALKKAIQKGIGSAGVAPAPKGEDRWARSGLENLGLQDQALLENKQVRRLLIEASDLKPGSQGLKRIKDQIDSITKGQNNDSLSGAPSKVPGLQRKPARGR
jgi:hypothetical protein